MARNLLVSLLLSVAWLVAGVAGAAPAGYVEALSGSLVSIKADGRKAALGVDSELDVGDTLQSYAGTVASLRFNDGGVVTLKPDSRFQVESYAFQESEPERDNLVFSLLKGGLRTLTGTIGKRNAGNYRMRTPTATIGIRGTDYDLLYCADGDCAERLLPSGAALADGLYLEVLAGKIAVTNAAGSVEIGAGQFGYVKDPQTPPKVGEGGYHDPASGGSVGECVAR